MQGGLSITRMPDGSLRSTTGAAGGDIVRAHRMPKDLQGDYLYGEEVARIVRRVRPEKTEGVTTIRNFSGLLERSYASSPGLGPSW